MSHDYRVYLSSTRKDLETERQAVAEALGGKCIVQQSYGASESDLIATCLDDVAACHMYIGIVGLRYGYCPVDPAKNPAGKSITELEYEQAIAKGVPRYIFIKDENSAFIPAHMDTHTKENGAGDRIKEFRDRLSDGKEQVPALFATVEDLKWKVLEAFFSFKAHREGGGAFMQAGRRLTAELERDIALAFVPGTDDLDQRSVSGLPTPAGGEDRRFLPFAISPNDPAYLLSLDPTLRRSRAVCWALTPASLSRYREQPELLTDVLSRVRRRSPVFALLQGVPTAELEPGWQFDSTLEVGAGQLQAQTADTLDRLHRHVREHSQALGQDRRVALSWVVIALKAGEAADLAGQTDQVMSAFKPAQRSVWKDQFERLRKALVATTGKSWPEDFYGATRADWKPFGQKKRDIATLLAEVATEINGERQAGSRESRLLGDAMLHLQRYEFDDYVDDCLGSRAALAGLKDRGCVVLVDEFALLHPALRAHAETFLTTQRAALVSANPTDPAWCSVDELLDDFSFLRVGSLFERFDKIGDPRCELALNSPRRLARWLRMILPEMVTTLGAGESDPGLVGRADQLLG